MHNKALHLATIPLALHSVWIASALAIMGGQLGESE
jgi:hypothetical protein